MLSTGLFCAKAAISMYQEPIKKPRSYTTKLQTKPEHQPDHHQVQAIRFLHFIKPHLHTQTHTTKKLRHFAENHPKQSTLCWTKPLALWEPSNMSRAFGSTEPMCFYDASLDNATNLNTIEGGVAFRTFCEDNAVL